MVFCGNVPFTQRKNIFLTSIFLIGTSDCRISGHKDPPTVSRHKNTSSTLNFDFVSCHQILGFGSHVKLKSNVCFFVRKNNWSMSILRSCKNTWIPKSVDYILIFLSLQPLQLSVCRIVKIRCTKTLTLLHYLKSPLKLSTILKHTLNSCFFISNVF